MSLITLDLDGTLLPNDTVFATVLRANGAAEFVADSDERYFSGAISLEECFWEQWGRISQLTLADCHRALRRAAWLPDISSGVHRLRAAGHTVRMLTDQPDILVDFLGRWSLIDSICSPVTVKEGAILGIAAHFDKLQNLQSHLGATNLSDVLHVGNGSNDIPIWKAAGQGLAVFAPRQVSEHATTSIEAPSSMNDIVDAALAMLSRPGQT
jgi:phosphoserine phosphatase